MGGYDNLYGFRTLAQVHDNPQEPRPVAIEGVLRVGDLCIVTGGWDTFKSTFSLEAAWSLATGRPFLGHLPVKRKMRMGIIQAEIDPGSYDERLMMYAPSDNLFVKTDFEYRLNEQGMEDMYVWMVELGLDGMVLDPLGPMWPTLSVQGDPFSENKKEHVIPILRYLKQLGKTFILVHHDPKPSVGIQNRASGTSALLNDPDTRVLIDKMNEQTIQIQVRSRLQHAIGQMFCKFTEKRRLVVTKMG